MNTYTLYNTALAVAVLPIAFLVTNKARRAADLFMAVRISVLLALIAYPWDFFAIRLHAWRYSLDPGVTLYSVPLNDLAFMWICTMLTSSVFLAIGRRNAQRS